MSSFVLILFSFFSQLSDNVLTYLPDEVGHILSLKVQLHIMSSFILLSIYLYATHLIINFMSRF